MGNKYVDDSAISDDEILWRRVHYSNIVIDDNQGRVRPSSAAFSDSSDRSPMSALRAKVVAETARHPMDVLAANHPWLTSMRVHFLRSLELGVDPRPHQGDEDAAHVYVFGKKTGSTKAAIAGNAEWVIGPSDEELLKRFGPKAKPYLSKSA